MKIIDKIALLLILIGAINFWLIELFKFDLVDAIFEIATLLSRIIYISRNFRIMGNKIII